MTSLTGLLQTHMVHVVPLLPHGHEVPQVPLLPLVPQVPLVSKVPLVTRVPLFPWMHELVKPIAYGKMESGMRE